MDKILLGDQLVELVQSISRKMKEGLTVDSRMGHLTLLQLQTLLFVKNKKEVQISEIATNFGVALPTASVLADKLVSSGFLVRETDLRDRRIVKLVITENGNKLVIAGLKQKNNKILKLLSYLSLRDKKTLLRILKTLKKALEEESEK